jgi:hypothetical protein
MTPTQENSGWNYCAPVINALVELSVSLFIEITDRRELLMDRRGPDLVQMVAFSGRSAEYVGGCACLVATGFQLPPLYQVSSSSWQHSSEMGVRVVLSADVSNGILSFGCDGRQSWYHHPVPWNGYRSV